ncbi:MAG TPA: hypothetical protein VH186_23285 [Chloroflexia bacterium]|nr:hypothetical protein [Chloroflexia bacterium]
MIEQNYSLKALSPVPDNLSKCLELLKAYRLPLRLPEALAYLSRLQSSASLLALYRHFFPVEFARSHAATTPEKGCIYSPREIEFFELVDERFFPLPLEYYLDLSAESGDERSERIEVLCLGLDWWELDLADLHPGWQLLLVLMGELELAALFPESPPAYWAAREELPWPRESLEEILREDNTGENARQIYSQGHLAALEKLVAREGEGESAVLSALPLALRILMHDTGNLWLDPTPETAVDDAYWCEEDVEYLAAAYAEARRMMEEADRLLDWLTESTEHLSKGVELWKKSLA